jgi:D-alanyl-D-alanine carboxypeptidase (penicillin-binding protein 5/6)
MWNNIRQQNRNGLLSTDPTLDGLKTGHTDAAGYCLITSARRDGTRLISVVLGAPSVKAREAASSALLSYASTFFQTVKAAKGGNEALATPRVYYSASKTAAVGLVEDLYVTVPRDQVAGLKTTVKLDERLQAPIAKSVAVGLLTITTADGKNVAQIPLVTLADVPQGGIFTRIGDRISMMFHH